MPSACVLTSYGPPAVLEWEEVPIPEPSETQVRIKVRVSGVGPTDLKIRRGDLNGAFPLPEPAVLGFETAGVVDVIGSDVPAWRWETRWPLGSHHSGGTASTRWPRRGQPSRKT